MWFTYIMTNKPNGTLYIGVTSNLSQRIYQHKFGTFKGSFTDKYKLRQLVYYEECGSYYFAFEREKQIKSWNRAWKVELVEGFNPGWGDLCDGVIGG